MTRDGKADFGADPAGDAPGNDALWFRFPGQEMAVRGALGELRRALGAARLSEDEADTMEIVLGEVLNNVVEHAYGPEQAGEIVMECESRGRGLFFTVRDFGRPMPEGRLPAGLPVDIERAREDLPEGGFGWFLVRSLARGLRYRRAKGCNVLSFCIPLDDFDCGKVNGRPSCLGISPKDH